MYVPPPTDVFNLNLSPLMYLTPPPFIYKIQIDLFNLLQIYQFGV